MGRFKKDYIPIYTEENIALADEFLQIVSPHYKEYLDLFGKTTKDGEDIAAESLIKCYNCIKHKGIALDENKDRTQQFLDYFFIATKFNVLTNGKQQQKRNELFNSKVDPLTSNETVETKVMSDLLKDFKVNYIIDLVEKNFDVITFRCFRIYYLSNKMTYAKLKEVTKVSDCKKRVCSAKKWLQSHIDNEQLLNDFEGWTDRFSDL